jgi:subfamily B ATP-binding cassette protein MsbA
MHRRGLVSLMTKNSKAADMQNPKGLLKVYEKDIRSYQRLLQYLRPYKSRFLIGLLASIPASALEGSLAFFIGPFFDRLIHSQEYSFLLIIPVAIVSVTIIQGFFEYVSQYLTTYVGNRICVDIQGALYRHLIGRDLSYYKQTTYGDIVSRYYSDAHKLQQAIVSNLQGFLIQFFTMLGLATVLLFRNWQLSIIALLIISLIVVPIAYLSRRIRELDYLLRQVSATMDNIFNETIYGVREVKSFNLYGVQIKRFEKTRQQVFSTAMQTAKKTIILSPIMQLIAGIGIGAIIFLGVSYVQNHQMTPGELTSFLVALLLLYKPVKVVASTIGKIQVILAPAERVFQLMDAVPAIQEPENPVPIDDFKSLEFKNVSFDYGPDKQILKNINLTIQAGEAIAIIGTSGGGKTTLIDLISRFIEPSEGTVLMNGTDLRQLSLMDLRSLVAMVSQETVLFNGTIRENILLGKLDASEEELNEALKVAHLYEWVSSLPMGLDTPIGDRASFVSGGQKQRIAIARTYLKKAPFLVLDEATSALDNESEAIVQNALMELMKNKTVIMVAHRLSTIRHASRILVMDAGRIVESGTHDELMALEGIYHKLYGLQFRDEERQILQAVNF